MIHREAGQTTFVHECELRRHSVTISWGAGYPALDVNSMPQVILPDGKSQFCHCGGDYERVEPCPSGEHDCHPIAGHVEQSDDHTANLIESPEPDPDETELARLKLLHWQLTQKNLISQLEARLDSFQYETEVEKLADQIVLLEAKRTLKMTEQKNA